MMMHMAEATPSTTSTYPVETHTSADAFGQAGVRQYAGRVLMWVCITASLCSLAMWYRSVTFFDAFSYPYGQQVLEARSVFGRLQFSVDTFAGQPETSNGRWQYRGNYVRRLGDAWQPSLWKTIGFEFRFAPADASATSGFWIRVKWYFVAAVFGLVCGIIGVLRLGRAKFDQDPA